MISVLKQVEDLEKRALVADVLVRKIRELASSPSAKNASQLASFVKNWEMLD